MGGMNRLSASLIALSTWQTLSGSVVASAGAPSAEANSFRRPAFGARNFRGSRTVPAARFRSRVDDAIDEYGYLERMVMDCTNDNNNEDETDAEARFAYELETERDFLRHCESSYLLRDAKQSETKVIPSSSAYNFKHMHDLFEV